MNLFFLEKITTEMCNLERRIIMPELTQQELNMLEQQLQYEKSMVKKYKFCYQFCNDPQLKIKCEQIAARHADHYMKLLDVMN